MIDWTIENAIYGNPRVRKIAIVPSRSGTSKYKGVSWDKNSQKFCAKYGSKHLGLFPDEVSAAHAYDTFTHLLHGDKASNNNIIQSTNATLSSFDIKKKDDLPRHIYKLGESFYALRKYKKNIQNADAPNFGGIAS